MKATAVAPANIAFIKYWGKRDEGLRLPANSSISMNLSQTCTTTTVAFSPEYKKDIIELFDGEFTANEQQKIVTHIDRIRNQTKVEEYARVVTRNMFPKGTGIASSASGFAALTLAGTTAAGLVLSEKELSTFARLGSGSACRSIPDGFVMWEAGPLVGGSSEDSYAYSLFPPSHWDLRDIVVIVSDKQKDISSAGGMKDVETSPLWKKRLENVTGRIEKTIEALQQKNLALLGEIIEEDCLEMHEVMQTQSPPLFYWTKETERVMQAVRSMRDGGIAVYFTIDAGPNVHLMCEATDEKRVIDTLSAIGIYRIIVNTPAPGAHLVNDHLF